MRPSCVCTPQSPDVSSYHLHISLALFILLSDSQHTITGSRCSVFITETDIRLSATAVVSS